MVCRRQNAALKSDGCYILFLRSILIVQIILRGNLKVTRILGVVRVRVNSFFFCLFLVLLLDGGKLAERPEAL